MRERRAAERGQGLVEYAMLIALIAILVAAALLTVGETIREQYFQLIVDMWPG